MILKESFERTKIWKYKNNDIQQLRNVCCCVDASCYYIRFRSIYFICRLTEISWRLSSFVYCVKQREFMLSRHRRASSCGENKKTTGIFERIFQCWQTWWIRLTINKWYEISFVSKWKILYCLQIYRLNLSSEKKRY